MAFERIRNFTPGYLSLLFAKLFIRLSSYDKAKQATQIIVKPMGHNIKNRILKCSSIKCDWE
jgi:hypothetical protein